VVTDAAYAACLRLAREHYENFPVASRLLPSAMRPHIAAIYAFARVADDFADEGDLAAADRLARLDAWERHLGAAVENRPIDSDDPQTLAIFTALGDTIRRCRLDPQLLHDLLSAFRQDVLVDRYDTWETLLDYCRRSANPVGRMVLSVAGCRDAGAASASDALCTALQLTNFWQDLERDWKKGRVYVPRSILHEANAKEEDLARGALTPSWRDALREVARRTRVMFDEGRVVTEYVQGRLRWELRATWLGGVRILDRLEAVEFDVFHRRPSLGPSDAVALVWRVMTFGPSRRRAGGEAPRSDPSKRANASEPAGAERLDEASRERRRRGDRGGEAPRSDK
jgi:squalene synthase HpnC